MHILCFAGCSGEPLLQLWQGRIGQMPGHLPAHLPVHGLHFYLPPPVLLLCKCAHSEHFWFAVFCPPCVHSSSKNLVVFLAVGRGGGSPPPPPPPRCQVAGYPYRGTSAAWPWQGSPVYGGPIAVSAAIRQQLTSLIEIRSNPNLIAGN